MKMLMLIIMTGTLLAMVPHVGAQEPSGSSPGPQPDVIVTAGEGLILAAPDRAFVSISAESRAKTPKDAQQQNATAMSAVQQKLKAAGLSGDAVRTTALDLNPELDYQSGKQTLRGYVANNTIEVRLDEIERVGEIVDLAVGSGATSLSGIRFELKDRQAVEHKALQQAMSSARGRAEALAQAANRTIERIIRIDGQAEHTPPPQPMLAAYRQAAAEAPTPVVPGQLEIRARVTLTVRIK
jgi:uncharacterized protein